MQQFEPLTSNKVASARSVSETNQTLDSQTQVQSVPLGLTTTKGDSKAKLRAMQLILQPVVAWVCLLATAKATGQFEFAYRYPAQAQIMLTVVPQLILLFVGLRLRNPRLAFIAGLMFAVITAMISLTLVNGTLGFVAAALMPFVAAASAAIANRPDIRKRYMSAMVGALGGFAAIIAATSGVVSETHGTGVSVAEAPPALTAPVALPPVQFRSESSTTMTIGNQDYNSKMVLESLEGKSAIFPAERDFEKGMTLKSADGSTQLNIDSDGILQWKHGNQLVDVVDTSEVPISAVSMNADGNMLVFKQAGMYMVFTPSKGARGLEEVLNQFSGADFQGDSQLGMILPEDIRGATWRPDGKQLTGRLSSGTFGDARFEFDVEKK